MDDDEYMKFIQCRQTKIFSKGFDPVLQWLRVRRDHTELKFRRVLEAFGYVLRYILQRIVLQAVKNENQGRLAPMARPISLEAYQEASRTVSLEVQAKCDQWHDQIIAFKVFKDEMQD